MPVGLPADPQNTGVERYESIGVRGQSTVELHVSAVGARMVPPAAAAVLLRTVGARREVIDSRKACVVVPPRETCTQKETRRLA